MIGTEIEMCLVFEKGKECRGAGGRKMRMVCVHCPNFIRYQERKEKEGENHGNESEDNH